MPKNSMRRVEEGAEGMKEIASSAPSSKFQGEQQSVDSTNVALKTTDSSFKPTTVSESGSKLKQEVAAKVVKDAQFGGSGTGEGGSFGAAKSSGSMNGILGASNATPLATRSRSRDIVSKKLDRASTKLNFIPCDTILVEWDESKPLAQQPEGGQGFNGTYRNEYARSQKNAEAVPGGLMFDRSLDLLTKDNVYFGQGQVVYQGGANADGNNVTRSSELNEDGQFVVPTVDNYAGGATGNFALDSVDFMPSEGGEPVFLSFNETELTPTAVGQHVANQSSAARLTLLNDSELVRETMDSKAGDEKADVWTPLPRAVAQPTQTVAFLRDIEAETGDEIMMAYRKASTSMSYQLNRAHKDGQDNVGPAIEALNGVLYNAVSKQAATTAFGNDLQALFTPAMYRAGSAATLIGLYDSTGKYSSKADFITQPRGLRMHLQTADNNIDPLHVSKLFAQAYDANEVFSTIDREFDPMSVVCMSDKATVLHRHSWDKLGSFYHRSVRYAVGSSTSTTATEETIIPAKFMTDAKEKGYNMHILYPHEAVGDMTLNTTTGVLKPSQRYEFANGHHFYVILDDQATATMNGYDVINTSNANLPPYLIYYGNADTNVNFPLSGAQVLDVNQREYLLHCGPFRYQYDDLRNIYVTTVAHPLLEGFANYLRDSIGAKYNAITRGRGVCHIEAVHSTQYFSLWSFLLCAATPWILKARINSMRDVLYYEKNIEYPFSSTLVPMSEVRTKAYSNFTYADYDTELTTGVMKPAVALSWVLPELYQVVGCDPDESTTLRVLLPWYSNQQVIRDGAWDCDASVMSFPSIRSGVKLASLDTLYGMTEADVRLSLDMVSSFEPLQGDPETSLCYKYSSVGDGQLVLALPVGASRTALDVASLPRQLGYFFTAPYGTLTPDYDGNRGWNADVFGTSSFVAKYWMGPHPVTTDDSGTAEQILARDTVNINRAVNFTQSWFAVLASGTIPPTDHGFVLSLNAAFDQAGGLLLGRTLFHPYCDLADNAYGAVDDGMIPMRTLQKALWTRVQKLPFILSPFDGRIVDPTSDDEVLTDPYDMLYAFGLGGFRASDFKQSVYLREKRVVNQGIEFVSDPWVEQSPIFHEGAGTSGVVTTQGFAL